MIDQPLRGRLEIAITVRDRDRLDLYARKLGMSKSLLVSIAVREWINLRVEEATLEMLTLQQIYVDYEWHDLMDAAYNTVGARHRPQASPD